MCMGGNNYEDWLMVAEQFSTQIKLCGDSMESWALRMKQTDVTDAAKAFDRAVMALEMAQGELAKAAGIFHGAQDHDHFHVEAFNVSGDRAPSSGSADHSGEEPLHNGGGHSHSHSHDHGDKGRGRH